MNPDRIRFHDANFRPAWQRKFGREATMNERVIGQAVAKGETNEGDAWPGPDKIVGTADDERNKGATNLRKLDVHERIVLAAKGAELIAARPDIPIRPRKIDLDRLDFTEVGTRDTNGVMKPMRFRWLFHKRGELKRGDENEDVKLWQEFLILNTFEIGDMDGKFGPLVEKATKEFQAKVGLPANGIVDEDLQRMADFDVLVPVEVPITPLEAEALAALTPTVSQGHESRAREVNRLIGEALPTSPAGATPAPTKKFPDGAYGTIHCDSHPGLGPFFVWFASFATPKPDVEDEIDSWKYYLDILCRSEAERAALAAGSPSLMARAMYFQSYFGGFHVKGKLYESPKGSGNMVDGAELNIADYANVIARHAPSIRAALA